MTLFCLPYAGGGASVFSEWPRGLAPEVAVCPIQLPGRENRFIEPPLASMDTLLAALTTEVGAALRGPFAIFGHSLGALVGYELARSLRTELGVQPAVLAVSGCRATEIPREWPDMHALPDDELLAQLRELNGTPEEVLAHRELMEVLLPVLRADFALIETYRYQPGEPFDCPIVAFGGDDDPKVRRAHLEAWAGHTRSSCSVETFSGDHFFLQRNRPAVIAALARYLRVA